MAMSYESLPKEPVVYGSNDPNNDQTQYDADCSLERAVCWCIQLLSTVYLQGMHYIVPTA